MTKVFIIAEIAQAHDGSLGILHSYIDAAAACGVDAVKFQTHIADAESSSAEPFRVNFSYVDKTRQDYWRRMEFTPEQWAGIKKHCDEVGVEFMSSPFSMAAVDILDQLDMRRWKIASGEVTNLCMLERIAKIKRQIIISSGMSSYAELDTAINMVKGYHDDYAIMQCTTSYPTPAEKVGLNVLQEMKKHYDCPVGLSDHSGRIEAMLAAVALGAEFLEAHIVFDKRMFGPDAKSSLEVDNFKQLVDGVRFLEKTLANPVDKNDVADYAENKKIFGKALSVRHNMNAGQIICFEDVETKKPSNEGIPAAKYKNIIGQKLARDMSANEFLKEEDIA